MAACGTEARGWQWVGGWGWHTEALGRQWVGGWGWHSHGVAAGLGLKPWLPQKLPGLFGAFLPHQALSGGRNPRRGTPGERQEAWPSSSGRSWAGHGLPASADVTALIPGAPKAWTSWLTFSTWGPPPQTACLAPGSLSPARGRCAGGGDSRSRGRGVSGSQPGLCQLVGGGEGLCWVPGLGSPRPHPPALGKAWRLAVGWAPGEGVRPTPETRGVWEPGPQPGLCRRSDKQGERHPGTAAPLSLPPSAHPGLPGGPSPFPAPDLHHVLPWPLAPPPPTPGNLTPRLPAMESVFPGMRAGGGQPSPLGFRG